MKIYFSQTKQQESYREDNSEYREQRAQELAQVSYKSKLQNNNSMIRLESREPKLELSQGSSKNVFKKKVDIINQIAYLKKF